MRALQPEIISASGRVAAAAEARNARWTLCSRQTAVGRFHRFQMVGDWLVSSTFPSAAAVIENKLREGAC
jgi:hypothetical protein